jgi:hypothetical protein
MHYLEDPAFDFGAGFFPKILCQFLAQISSLTPFFLGESPFPFCDIRTLQKMMRTKLI